jgi:hypothetical protein
MTSLTRTVGLYIYIFACGVLGLSFEYTGQMLYIAGRKLMDIAQVVQDHGLKVLGVAD